MKVFLKRILIFFLVAIPGYCVILVAWSNLIPFEAFKKNMNYKMGSYGHMYTRTNEANNIQKTDVLVLGSSHAYRGFDPRVFKNEGIELFNLGSSNQTPRQGLVLLKEYLNQVKPELVIYEVYPGIFQQDGLESTLDILANGPFSWPVATLAFKANHIKAYNALINRAFLQFCGTYESYNEPLVKPKDGDTYVRGGYVQKDDSYVRAQRIKNAYSWNIRQDQWSYFLEIVELLKKEKVELLMVQSPIDSTYFENILNNDEVDSRFSGLGNYINFSRLMKLHYKEDLYDLHHLKQSGVEKFNKVLIETLMEEGYLK